MHGGVLHFVKNNVMTTSLLFNHQGHDKDKFKGSFVVSWPNYLHFKQLLLTVVVTQVSHSNIVFNIVFMYHQLY